MLKKIKTFILLPRELKWLFVKAFFLSAFVKFTLVFLPFKKVMKWLGKSNVESSAEPDVSTLAYRRWVRRAIGLCDRYSFWKTECYTQALTAKLLLQQKKIPATLYIGFYKDTDGKFKGHAWLRSADSIITGKAGMELYEVHSFFS